MIETRAARRLKLSPTLVCIGSPRKLKATRTGSLFLHLPKLETRLPSKSSQVMLETEARFVVDRPS